MPLCPASMQLYFLTFGHQCVWVGADRRTQKHKNVKKKDKKKGRAGSGFIDN